jgi:hypothetical protein
MSYRISIILNILFVVFCASLFAQRYGGELRIRIVNPPTSKRIEVDNVGGAAWDDDFDLTSSYNSYDLTDYDALFDHVTDVDTPNRDGIVAYAKYRIRIDNTYTTYVDFRDCAYRGDEMGEYGGDIDVEFDWTDEEFSLDPSSGNIWGDGNPKDISKFKVPLTVQNQDILGNGKVNIADNEYDSPKTCSATWQSTYTIEAPDQTVGGLEWDFDQWTDASTSNPRNVTIGSTGYCATSYSYTARHDKTVPYPSSFNVGENNDHPYLTWTAQTGTYISGYYIYRNYNEGGWSKVKTITNKTTNNWTDTDVDYDAGGNPVYYKMKTYDVESDESGYTSTESVKGYILNKMYDGLDVKSHKEFSLLPNSPNPFNPVTTIGFSLVVESDVRLSVYNLLGERVRMLIHDRKGAGVHSVIWDSRDDQDHSVPAGIYIYRLEAVPVSGEEHRPFTASRKLILAK